MGGGSAASPPHKASWAAVSGASWPSPIIGAGVGDARGRGGSNSILDNMPIGSVERESPQPAGSTELTQKFYSVQV